MNQADHVEHVRMERIRVFHDLIPALPSPEEVRQALGDAGCAAAIAMENSVRAILPGGARIFAVHHGTAWRVSGAPSGVTVCAVTCTADLVALTSELRGALRPSVHPAPAA